MITNPIPRLDKEDDLHERLTSSCRLQPGEVWEDPISDHRVGCLDAASADDVAKLCGTERASLAIQDPPYNLVAFNQRSVTEYICWCQQWVANTEAALLPDSSFYIWLGADQDEGFQPLPEFMIMMRATPFASRSFITMRNQRGYGTQHNWMAVRQELLYYTKGKPFFTPQYTEIPKAVKGYYKVVGDEVTENTERGKSPYIRAGNVWFDIQQVFYRLEENVNGCYAQKPLKAIERIINASSQRGDAILDFFAHSGTTLLQAELSGRRCFTMDNDPLFCEIAIRRLEHYRQTGELGWQNSNPFATELKDSHPERSNFDDRQLTLFDLGDCLNPTDELWAKLNALIERLDDPDSFRVLLDAIANVYPFNRYEYTIANLLGHGKMSLPEYEQLRQEYVAAYGYPYREVFEIRGPRTFGDKWVSAHLVSVAPGLKRASRILDTGYGNQDYDFWLDPGIRIEVKAGRVVGKSAQGISEPLTSSSNQHFDVNFQQIKVRLADVFVLVAVWLDVVRYWVFNSAEITSFKGFSSAQHKGNVGEGQLHLTNRNIGLFEPFEAQIDELERKIIKAYQRLAATSGQQPKEQNRVKSI
jgi:site-specific DNA-methyltransferase (adenine-specific)